MEAEVIMQSSRRVKTRNLAGIRLNSISCNFRYAGWPAGLVLPAMELPTSVLSVRLSHSWKDLPA